MNRLKLFRPKRRKTGRWVALALLSGVMSLGMSGCRCRPVERDTDPNVVTGQSEAETPSVSELPPILSPPTVEQLVDRSQSPYHHNPVGWRYLTARSVNEVPVWDAWVSMTTTVQRTTVEGVGLLFKLVVENQGAGPNTTQRGEIVEQGFQSVFALLTPSGLFVGPPTTNPEETFEGREEELIQTLLSTAPSWPLPGTAGCQFESRDVQLPFAQTRALVTSCPQLRLSEGVAQVTTAWIDRVGFAYREVISLDETGEQFVETDVLVDGDLLELAPASTGNNVLHLGI